MKASVTQILKEVEGVKSALAEDNPRNARAFQLRARLCWLLEELLLTDLEFALDKKVEQELWNSAFRNPIAAFQAKPAEKKDRANGESHTTLSTLLETASGFYLQLFQKLCSVYNVSLRCHFHEADFGIFHLDEPEEEENAAESETETDIEKPKKSSVLYICQHCLVHLGDIARYRSQSLQAENFYRHAVELGPQNGHPYNQIALLEAASGEKLSAVFFHVRSLALQHPFPAAATNLSKLYSKMVSDVSASIGKTKMTPYEYTTAFLQFHAHIYLYSDMVRAEGLLGSLTSCLPALVMVEKLDTWQLLQMVAICMFSQQHCTQAPEPPEPRPGRKPSQLLLDLVASMLHAFLLPMHALQDPRDMRDCVSVPVVKVVLDWLLCKQEILRSEAFVRKPQVWHGFCKLLNALVLVVPADFPKEEFATIPLPEDWDVQCFTPLQEAHRDLIFDYSSSMLGREEMGDVRASRLLVIAEVLGKIVVNNKSLIGKTEDTPPRYIATHYTEAMRKQVMQQIEQLSIEPEGDSRKSGSAAVSDRGSEGGGPEVRFKLENDGQPSKGTDLIRRGTKGMMSGRDRRPGRTVSMQGLLKHEGRSQSAQQQMMSQGSSPRDEKPPWYHQPQMFVHAMGNNSSNSHLNFPPLPPLPNGQPLSGATAPVTFDPGVTPSQPQQAQQPTQPLFGLPPPVEGAGSQASFVSSGPPYLWNFFVPQMGPLAATPGVPPPSLVYLGAQPVPASQQLENLLRQQSLEGATPKVGPDLYQAPNTPAPPPSSMAQQPPARPPWVPPPQLVEVNGGCQVGATGGAAQASGSDLPANTYSLFNSPWPSGLHHMAKEGGCPPAGAIDPMVMHSRIQSLWSGPGPSPLERLLEQQKQWRDGATQ